MKTLTFGSWVLVLLSMIAQATAQEVPPIRPLPLPEARVSGGPESAQGNVWLRLSADHQLGYVQGLLEGTFYGYLHACTKAQIVARSVPHLQEKCMENAPAAHLKSEQYMALVTEFYSKYPQDRALPMRRLLEKLLKPGMTTDGVHKWLDELIEDVRRVNAN